MLHPSWVNGLTMPLASTWKNSTFCIGKTLKRAANSNGLRGPDVPKNNHPSTAASAILPANHGLGKFSCVNQKQMVSRGMTVERKE